MNASADRLARAVLTAPFIYAMAVPIAFLDVTVSLYQAVCFRVWGVERASRSAYLVIDRHRLSYLNAVQKVHCVYCGYANGVLAYAVDVAARTEQFWCPIKHATDIPAPHDRYAGFLPYGDARAFAEKRLALREAMAEQPAPTAANEPYSLRR